MGLDITFYERITKISVELDEDGEPKEAQYTWEWYDEHLYVHVNLDYPTHADDVVEGWYKSEGDTECLHISYRAYNQWRNDLAMAALKVPATMIWGGRVTEGPFVKLINFSDCEGTLGPLTCAKLAKDFNEWETKVEKNICEDRRDYFMKKYREFKIALTLAAESGVACFH